MNVALDASLHVLELPPHVLEFLLLPALPLCDLLSLRTTCTLLERLSRRSVCFRLGARRSFGTLLSFGELFSDSVGCCRAAKGFAH
jgi:hypothetical protein